MIGRYIFPFVFIFTFSCNAQPSIKKVDDESLNAKWFYYSYAMELNAYNSNGTEIQPLACNIKINSVKHVSADTTKFYFSLYDKDTVNICYLKPLALLGITVVRNKLFIPIYHTIIFDSENDSTVLEKMKKQSLLLQNKVLENKENINSWLQTEAEKKKSF
jgi:hypothetical protein